MNDDITDETLFESFDGFLPPVVICLPGRQDEVATCDVTPSDSTVDRSHAESVELTPADDLLDEDDDEGTDDEHDADRGLTDEDVEILDRMSEWLVDARAAADEFVELTDAGDADNDDRIAEPGLLRLVEEFTALRQDVKLQTKSGRALQDQTESLLSGLNRAIEQFQTVTPREDDAVRNALKPILESLTDVDTSLERGRMAAEAARARWMNESSDDWQTMLNAELRKLSVWKRWLANAVSKSLSTTLRSQFAASWSASQDAHVEGYRLIQNRLRRILEQQQVERIECVGRQVDPNRMNVIDVADHESLPAGTVLEELRPGYLWRGQLLRYAEVRVVRSRSES